MFNGIKEKAITWLLDGMSKSSKNRLIENLIEDRVGIFNVEVPDEMFYYNTYDLEGTPMREVSNALVRNCKLYKAEIKVKDVYVTKNKCGHTVNRVGNTFTLNYPGGDVC